MINLIETPQRADIKSEYTVDGDVLTVTIGDTTETFDFTDFPDGQAVEIEVENLPVNPIVSIRKENGIIEVAVIRFYGLDEKHLFEGDVDG